MNMIKKISLLFFLVIFSKVAVSQTSLEYIGDYSIVDNDIYLSNAIDVKSSHKNQKILWGEQKKFYLFDYDGNLIISKKSSGRGPTEFSRIDAIAANEEYFALLDASLARVLYFDWEGKFVTSYTLKRNQLAQIKNIELDSFSNLVIMKELIFPGDQSAILVYDKTGRRIADIGVIPNIAMTQTTRNGGGITLDNSNIIYYSYLSEGKIYKTDIKSKEVVIISDPPEYFSKPDIEIVKRIGRDQMKMIPLTFDHSRISDLLYLETETLIQQIEIGNPWKDEEVIIYLEFYEIKSNTKTAKVKIENRVATTWKENEILIFHSLLRSEKIAQNKSLFEIYRVVK